MILIPMFGDFKKTRNNMVEFADIILQKEKQKELLVAVAADQTKSLPLIKP